MLLPYRGESTDSNTLLRPSSRITSKDDPNRSSSRTGSMIGSFPQAPTLGTRVGSPCTSPTWVTGETSSRASSKGGAPITILAMKSLRVTSTKIFYEILKSSLSFGQTPRAMISLALSSLITSGFLSVDKALTSSYAQKTCIRSSSLSETTR